MSILSDIFTSERREWEQTIPPGRVLVVTSCTKDKKLPSGSQQQLGAEQLWDEGEDDRVTRDFGLLEQFRTPAGQLYTGRQHQQLMQGVTLLREMFGHDVVDVKIISAGFGVVDETQPLPPYNVTFADQSTANILAIAQRLHIPQVMSEVMTNEYDCAFFLLGENYLLSLGLPFAQPPRFPCLFLAGPSSRKKVPRRSPYFFVRVGQDDSIAFSYNLVGLKGHLVKLFAEQLVTPLPQTPPDVLDADSTQQERFIDFLSTPTPQHFLKIVQPFRHEGRVSIAQAKAQERKDAVQPTLLPPFIIKAGPQVRNHERPMRYFIPDWDDLVDPGYDFEHDVATHGRKKYLDEVYAHQLYQEPNYDGLLLSKGTVEHGPVKTQLVRDMGIHRFTRFEDKPILADCGAFSYIAEEKPPYQTQEMLDYYQQLGFDYGVSVDHLIIPAFYPVKEYRYQLTRENAYDFLQLHRAGGYTFTPVGVAQGWSPETYRDAVVELLEWGYTYIGLGGLARAKTEEILDILEVIAPVLQSETDLHLFGVARDREGDEMLRFRRLGVTSFDSASYLRRAWMSATTNYFTEDGGRYAAVRISPVYPSSPRVKRILADGIATYEQLQQLEQQALKAIRAYDKNQLGLEETLEALLEIDKVEEYQYEQHLQLYRKVLVDQPWKQCACPICRDLGVEVIIFRGNDRNRRRGFHNTHVFYKRFQALMEQAAQKHS